MLEGICTSPRMSSFATGALPRQLDFSSTNTSVSLAIVLA
jgi:hypothetical protein